MSYTVYDTKGLVVNSWAYKDASRRLVLYTKKLGRILVRAQAVRKLTSKLGPAVQPFSESQVELVYGQSGWRLVGASPQQNYFLGARQGRAAMRRSIDLFTRLVPAQKTDQKLYNIATDGLQALAQVSEVDRKTAEKLFVFRLVAHLGYAPDKSAQDLLSFARTSSYEPQVLSGFQDVEGVAVSQINQALENVQM